MKHWAEPPICWTGASLLALCCCGHTPGPLSPEEALRSFRIAEGFRIELYASEPHVVDPVEMAFDEHGGAYVAELLDNPDDPPDGEEPLSRIKHLEDADGDGRVDGHTVFADRLLAVEGIHPWRGGLIVTASPDILFLKDTDGDHVADVREVLYTGFGLRHVELRLSNPRFGLDNWFYVANSGVPGEVTSPARPDLPPVSVRNREFRFHPLRGLAEPSTGDAQFGQSYNAWGHWFITHNTVHIRHTVVPPGYVRRNPYLAFEETEQDISDHGRPAAEVYAISQPQQWRIDRTTARSRRYAETRPGREERLEGHFTAASGSTVYVGDAFPSKFAGSVFVGEGNGNLVHCDLLRPDGATYAASRWPADAAFLASTDNWFRPVNFANGPDGSLYVLDYYRQYLEHPLFIPESVKARLNMDFRAGDTLGRIYRIVPDGPPVARQGPVAAATSPRLAALLEHANGWHRRTAHRLLVERQDHSVEGALRELALSSPVAQARLHALWVLEGINALDQELVGRALQDRHPAVRESAVRLAEGFTPALSERVREAVRDPDDRVSFQATLSTGSQPLTAEGAATLAESLARHPADKWFHVAVLSAPADFAVPVLETAARLHPNLFRAASQPATDYIRSVALVAGARRRTGELRRFLRLLAGPGPLAEASWQAAGLDGLAAGLALRRSRRLEDQPIIGVLLDFLDHPDPDVRRAAASAARFVALPEALQADGPAAFDRARPLAERIAATYLLQGAQSSDASGTLEELLNDASEPDLQAAAARALGSFDGPEATRILLAALGQASPRARSAITEALIRTEERALALLEAVADGRIAPGDIPAVTRIRLSQHPGSRVRQAATASLSAAPRDRDYVVREHLHVLRLDGDPRRGKAVFDEECSSCHLRQSSRGRIGPDLSGVSNRSKEDLLTSILDPNYAIEERYRNYILETADGRFHDGILVAETSAKVTLRGEREDVSILKDDIVSLRQSQVSLMPEGLEEAFDANGLADLLAYLQAGL